MTAGEDEASAAASPGPVIHLPERDLGEAESENGAAPAAPRSARAGLTRRQEPPQEAGRRRCRTRGRGTAADEPSANGAEPSVAADSATAVEPVVEPRRRDPCRSRARADGAPQEQSEPEPETEADADEGKAADAWEYTPMSEWGMDER